MTLLLCLLVFSLTAQVAFARGSTSVPQSSARVEHGYPSWPMPAKWKSPVWWLKQALCIHRHESVDWYRAGTDWRGNRSPYYGGMQFLIDTWRRSGGTGLPSDASPREQLFRAYVIWDRHVGRMGDGRGNWSEWGTARACGLR